MISTIQDMLTRRSCRSYQKKQISDEELDKILKVGTFAPTGRNHQSPVIVAIQDRSLIAQLTKINADIMGKPDIDPFFGAPTILVVLADKSCPTYLYDGSCVIDNMLHAAHALDLGACWVHRAKQEFESDFGKDLLKQWGVTGDCEGIGHCVVGYPNGEIPAVSPRKEGYIVKIR